MSGQGLKVNQGKMLCGVTRLLAQGSDLKIRRIWGAERGRQQAQLRETNPSLPMRRMPSGDENDNPRERHVLDSSNEPRWGQLRGDVPHRITGTGSATSPAPRYSKSHAWDHLPTPRARSPSGCHGQRTKLGLRGILDG